eukprot:TRINITY_DN20182_c0_g1_i1.p1 TRINITY_DN20182_c0_g1~~TRINITY_DN20182_c0_g1_i1.p1  ORF type:complete len:1420 (+),score=247.00 TRINITY_DN20182_c0_g1_i1:198-4457(+)
MPRDLTAEPNKFDRRGRLNANWVRFQNDKNKALSDSQQVVAATSLTSASSTTSGRHRTGEDWLKAAFAPAALRAHGFYNQHANIEKTASRSQQQAQMYVGKAYLDKQAGAIGQLLSAMHKQTIVALQVGFDETLQKVYSTSLNEAQRSGEPMPPQACGAAPPAPDLVAAVVAEAMHAVNNGPPEAELPNNRTGTKRGLKEHGMAVESQHSMVNMGRLLQFGLDHHGNVVPETVLQENIVLPPVQLDSVGHKSIGGALLNNIQSHIFGGTPLETALAELSQKVGLVIIVLVGDSAGANLKLADILHNLVFLSTKGNHVIFWFQPCNLHQVCRISAGLLGAWNISAAMDSATRVFRLKKYRKQLHLGLRKCIGRNLVWEPFLPCPASPSTTEAWRSELTRLILTTWPDEDDSEERATPLKEAFRRFLGFWNGDVVADAHGHRLCHFCNGSGCHGSRDACVKEGVTVTMALVKALGLPSFIPSRWTKQLPGLRFWCCLELVGGMARKAFAEIVVSADEANNSEPDAEEAVDGNAALRKLAGKRMKKIRTFWDGPWAKFHLATSFSLLGKLESLVAVLFRASDLQEGSVAGSAELPTSKRRRTPADRVKLDKSRRSMGGHTGKKLVILTCNDVQCRLWSMAVKPSEKVLAVARPYAPAGASDDVINRKNRAGVMNMAGGIYLRLTVRHRSPPDCWHTLEGDNDMTKDRKTYGTVCEMPACCKDKGVTQVLEAFAKSIEVADPDPDDAVRAFKAGWLAWATSCRQSSLAEEMFHAWLKRSFSTSPSSYAAQAAASVCQSLERNWRAKGLRALDTACDSVAQARSRLTLTNRASYAKPNAVGRLDWYYKSLHLPAHLAALAHDDPLRVAEETRLLTEFRSLTADEKNNLREQAKAAKQQALLFQHLDQAARGPVPDRRMETPWNLADSRKLWPLLAEDVEAMLGKFHSKAEAMVELGKLGLPAESLKRLADMSPSLWIRNKGKWDAARLSISTVLGTEYTVDMANGRSDLKDAIDRRSTVVGAALVKKPCGIQHHGFCCSRDAEHANKLEAFRLKLGRITKDLGPLNARFDAVLRFTTAIHEPDEEEPERLAVFVYQCAGKLLPAVQVYCLMEAADAMHLFANKGFYNRAEVAPPLKLMLTGRPCDFASSHGLEEPHLLVTSELGMMLQRFADLPTWSIDLMQESCGLGNCTQVLDVLHCFGTSADTAAMPPPSSGVRQPKTLEEKIEAAWRSAFFEAECPDDASKRRVKLEKGRTAPESDSSELDEEEFLVKELLRLEKRLTAGKLRKRMGSSGESASSDADAGPSAGDVAEPPLLPPPAEPAAVEPPPPPAPVDDSGNDSGGSRASLGRERRTDFDEIRRILGDRWPLDAPYRIYAIKDEGFALWRGRRYVRGSRAMFAKGFTKQGAIDFVYGRIAVDKEAHG